MGLHRRLERLEAVVTGPEAYTMPIGMRVLVKTVERERACIDALPPPGYTQEEIEELRRGDVEIVAGGGTVSWLRDDPGWQTPEAQALLDEWEADARRRVELTEALPPERWHEVYEDDLRSRRR